jgi:hypothetical protein
MTKSYDKRALYGIIALIAAVSIIVPAYAIAITGQVKDTSNVGLNDPKITAERIGEYAWTRGGTAGTREHPTR